jgi:flagellin-like protein
MSSPFVRDRRGVSPAIGVVLLVAIVIVLAATVGAMAMGFESVLSEPKHPVAFDTTWVADGTGNTNGAYVNLTFTGGEAIDQDRVVVVDYEGNRVTWEQVWTTPPGKQVVEPGDYVHLDSAGSDTDLRQICEAGDVYRIVVEGRNGRTTVVDEFEADSPPTATNSDCSP